MGQTINGRSKFQKALRINISLAAFIAVFFIYRLPALSQRYVDAPNPPSIDWKVINNEKSKIIFPKGVESEAIRIAETIDYIQKNKSSSIGSKALQVPIVLHTQSMEPNGFVASVPFRSEFYALSIPDWNTLGPNNWLDVLAIHEYRHVLQASNADIGFTRLSRFITGRSGWSLTKQLTTPNWFSEGDAVITESLFTPSGRGRMPSFSMEQRAIFAANKDYSYLKSRHGSFKSQMPSHYPFGYRMSLYARKEFGNEVWADIVKDANWFRSIIYPFAGAIKKNIGLSPRKLYKASYSDFENQVDHLLADRTLTDLKEITEPEKRTVTYFSYPFINAAGEFIARKSSYKETPYLMRINSDGSQTKLVDIGHTSNPYISYSPKSAIWVENKEDLRWGNVDTKRVALYNFETHKKTYILEGKKIFYAAISPDGTKVSSVEFDKELNFSIKEYAINSESELKELNIPSNAEIAYPMYDSGSNSLFYTIKQNNKQSWVKHNLDTDEFQFLCKWYAHAMVEPAQNKENIFFRASFDGIDNIYSLTKSGTGEIKRVSSSEVAAGFPFIHEDELLFSNYHLTGNNLVKADLSFEPFLVLEPTEMPIYADPNNLPENDQILEHLPDVNYKVKEYKPFLKDWKFHSYGVIPSFGSSENSSLPSLNSAQVYLQMDDILSTNSLELNYTRYITEGQNGYGFNYAMGKFFPILQIGYEYRGRSIPAQRGDRMLQFDEQEVMAGIQIPLNSVKNNYEFNTNLGVYWKGITPFVRTSVSTVYNDPFGLYELTGSFSALRRQAYQNLQSRFGVSLSAKYDQSFQQGTAGLIRYSANIFLPGIGKNHGLQLLYAHQTEKLTNTYQFPDVFGFARGFDIGGLESGHRVSMNYKLPLLYPDLGLPGFTYLRRVRANIFFDTANISDSVIQTRINSTGVELRFDQVAFNFLELPIGVRLGYRLPNEYLTFDKPFFINLLLGD